MAEPIIFHIDMNSYFASCEQQANSLLRGKPVGVCEHLGGIIIAPSVEAKKLGIKTGTPVWEAKKICPSIVLVNTDPEKYRFITAKFLRIFYSYTEQVEKYSIDEAFLDFTDDLAKFADPWAEARRIAYEIKEKIRTQVGEWIRCSIGVGSNKLIAKLGSDLQKPDGLVIVPPSEQHLLYDRLKLIDIPGIGRRMEANLNFLGIKTLADLRDYPVSKLISHFGIMGQHLHNMGQLKNSWREHDYNQDQKIKSMGHAYTLPQATADPKLALQVLYKLSEMVGRRMREAKVTGSTVFLIATDKQGESIHKHKKLDYQTADGREIFMEIASMFEEATGKVKKFRLVGVTVSNLTPYTEQQSLFEPDQRKSRLVGYLDEINDKYGDFTISRVSAWQARSVIRDSIGFGRMREFKVNFKRGK